MKEMFLAPLALAVAMALTVPALAQTTGSISKTSRTTSAETYSTEEIMAAGHQFFGKASRGLPSLWYARASTLCFVMR